VEDGREKRGKKERRLSPRDYHWDERKREEKEERKKWPNPLIIINHHSSYLTSYFIGEDKEVTTSLHTHVTSKLEGEREIDQR